MRSLLLLYFISFLFSQNYPRSKIYDYYENCIGSVNYNVNNSMESYEQSGLILSFNNADYVFVFCSYDDIQAFGSHVTLNGGYKAQITGYYDNKTWPYLYFFLIDIGDYFHPLEPNYLRTRDLDLTSEFLSIGFDRSVKRKIREGYVNRKISSDNNISLYGKIIKTGSKINDIIVSPNGKLIGLANKVIGYNTISIMPYEIIKKIYSISNYKSFSDIRSRSENVW